MTLNTPLCEPQRIALDVVGSVTVSTVKLSANLLTMYAPKDCWETVVFYSQTHSYIVETYSSREEAVLGHVEWVDHHQKEEAE